MVEILDCFFDTVYTLLKGQVDKRTMLDNLELILLSIDEAVSHYRYDVISCPARDS